MAKKDTYDICVQHLYDDVSQLTHLAPQHRDKLLRIRSGYTLMNEFPSKKDREIIQHIQNLFKVERSAAYDDLRIIKDLLGSTNKQSKDYRRYQANCWLEEAVSMARIKNNEENIIKAAAVSDKINQLNKEDAERIPWDEIIPQVFEPTEDPTVLGIKPIPNIREKIAAMKKKYMNEIEDVTYDEIDIAKLEEYADK